MKLGQLVLRLRSKTTTFSGAVGGAAEYAWARYNTLNNEMAFVIPLQETAERNEYDTDIQQKMREQFAVVVAVKNDTDFEEKTGFNAYNRLHDIRQEIFEAFLGYDVGLILGSDHSFESESLIYYSGGQLIDLNRAYMWYQFTFEYNLNLTSQAPETATNFLDSIYAQYEILPSGNLPTDEDLPIEMFAPDMTQFINLQDMRIEKERYEEFSHGAGFGKGFDSSGEFKLLSPNDKLVSHWDLNEASGLIAADGPGYNHGTLTNMLGSEWVNGVAGSGIKFTANDQYIDCAAAKTLDMGIDSFALAIWVKSRGILNGGHHLMRKYESGAGFFLMIDSADRIRAYIEDSEGFVESDGMTVITDNSLHFVVANFNRSGNLDIYVDKVLDHSIDISSISGTISSSADFLIGSNCNGVTVDEPRLYRGRNIKTAEIEWLYNNPKGF